jgi:soluble lytic murein transglycosylase-like protein
MRRLSALLAAFAFAATVVAADPASAAGRVRERRWVDDEGVLHIEVKIGPSVESRKKAATVQVETRATGQKQKVREKSDFDLHIVQAAERYQIPHELVRAIIAAESNFDPGAVSRVGARGLMQLMPGTAAELGVTDAYDPRQNVEGGVKYLKRMMDMFGGDLEKAVAAYHAGPGTVQRYGGVPPYDETRNYVRRILG